MSDLKIKDTYSTEQASNQLRFLERSIVFEHCGDIKHQTVKVLQQAWQITERSLDGRVVDGRWEWRDVPTVLEPPTAETSSPAG